MSIAYNIAIYLYYIGVWVASFFSQKVSTMWKGEKRAFGYLKSNLDPNARYLWFHAASLGEFEQGRTMMERIKKSHPEYKILLTFFSPSGYEVRKDYDVADLICYLPLDTPRNARRFVSMVKPEIAFFIKYEFWYNYLHALKHRSIPVYSISSIFRDGQVFFRWYGKEYSKSLKCFNHLYVQNEKSQQLLASIGINNTSIVGDTRFDRVLQIRDAAKQLPIVKSFIGNGERKVFIAGSSWPGDEAIFIPYFNGKREDTKMIIAPHVVTEEHLSQIIAACEGKIIRYTLAEGMDAEALAAADVLIIDCYGLLSSIYNYADITLVGGGFDRTGVHNVLEAAVWDKPVVYGPNYEEYREAIALVKSGGGL
ncbi:MAG: glycosyltransferase N-terminal domain-containing protein, partial [Prevotellaceae bacterium]|nr:glycosyltransferase N-terminal domain-containing protein [Prevotellaceae bacterium]